MTEIPQCFEYMQAFSQSLAQINIHIKKGKDIFKM